MGCRAGLASTGAKARQRALLPRVACLQRPCHRPTCCRASHSCSSADRARPRSTAISRSAKPHSCRRCSCAALSTASASRTPAAASASAGEEGARGEGLPLLPVDAWAAAGVKASCLAGSPSAAAGRAGGGVEAASSAAAPDAGAGVMGPP